MAYLLDTSVAIHLRDGHLETSHRIASLTEAVLISVVTRVELEGGVYRDPVHTALRRRRLDLMLRAIPSIAFDDASAEAYAMIVANAGYSRRKILDRMIAAQALVHRATVITMNRADFADVDGLQLLEW